MDTTLTGVRHSSSLHQIFDLLMNADVGAVDGAIVKTDALSDEGHEDERLWDIAVESNRVVAGISPSTCGSASPIVHHVVRKLLHRESTGRNVAKRSVISKPVLDSQGSGGALLTNTHHPIARSSHLADNQRIDSYMHPRGRGPGD